MNGKAARNLRNLVKEAVRDNLPSENVYEDKVVYKEVQVGVKEDGTPRKIVEPRITKVLQGCHRALYQQAKRRHYLYVHH